jgi:aspartyl-tRNA(Asn)/glutamyl-tRNA(Gln) amidotransferase subunit A
MLSVKSPVAEIPEMIKRGEVTAVDIVEGYLNQIQKNAKLNAVTEINSRALDEAIKTDQLIQKGQALGRLSGLPVAIKDMINTKGLKTTAGSKMLENYVSPYSATLVERLEREGAIVIGKTNQDEFAMGSSSEHSYFGPTKNPWNLEFVPGGSSGGSAAVVAAKMSPAAIGTDTGGSIRQPAHFCGIVGLKPTYGRISRYGVVAYASSLDQAGPMTKTVKDAAILAEVMSGVDERDATTSRTSVPAWAAKIQTNLKGKKIGLPRQYLAQIHNQGVAHAQSLAQKALVDAGAAIVEVDLPLVEFAVPVYYLIAASEASSNLARYDGVRYGYRSDFSGKTPGSLEEFYCQTRGEGFGSEVKRRLVMGTYFLSAGYSNQFFHKASRVRRLLRQEMQKCFKACDFILSPVALSPAFRIGEKISDPLEMYLNDILTVTANLVGIPAMSVPVSRSQEGLPIGVQLMGRPFDEQMLFDAGSAIEERVAWTCEVPDGT